jgi:hypothetical protein
MSYPYELFIVIDRMIGMVLPIELLIGVSLDMMIADLLNIEPLMLLEITTQPIVEIL